MRRAIQSQSIQSHQEDRYVLGYRTRQTMIAVSPVVGFCLFALLELSQDAGSRSALAKTQTLAYGKLEGRTSLGSAKYRNAITPGNYERMKHDMHDRP